MQIENLETSSIPSSPDAQSPEGIASLSSGSSDSALGKYNSFTHLDILDCYFKELVGVRQ